VNRLVNALITYPQVIEQMAETENASFVSLLDALGNAIFSVPELYRIQDDRPLRQRLEAGYLPTITAAQWEYALSLTENRTTISSGWWTVMIAGTSGHFGLTAPQNGSESELVALFAGPAPTEGILVYDPVLGTISEVDGGPHCGPSSRGRCKGRCNGCVAFEVYDESTHSTGIKCLCPHQGA
jgi:hypothetical protein